MKFIRPTWPAPATINAYTTLRHNENGLDEGMQNKIQREEWLKKLLPLPAPPIWLAQTHSTIVIEATLANTGQVADAAFTATPHQVCAILTADCLPILICNQQGTQVAAIHAGWRGLAADIIEATLQKLSVPTSDLLVWLGPAIGPTKFEVGTDVYDAFTSKHSEAACFFKAGAPDKWFADLYGLAKMRLKRQGIKQIYGGDFCTFSQDDLFYSYRRDKGRTGRMVSLIWINE